MPISVATTNAYTESGTAGTSHVLSGITTTAGNPIMVAVSAHGGAGAVSSVVDSAGNVYERIGQAFQSTSVETTHWITRDTPIALSSGTITVTTSSAVGVVFRYYELGTARTKYPVSVTSACKAGSSTSPGSGTQQAGDTTDLVIGTIGVAQTETFSSISFTAGAGTDHKDASTTTGSVVEQESSSKVMSATTAQAYSATINSSGPWASVISRFLVSNSIVYSKVRSEDVTVLQATRTRDKFSDTEALTGQLFPNLTGGVVQSST